MVPFFKKTPTLAVHRTNSAQMDYSWEAFIMWLCPCTQAFTRPWAEVRQRIDDSAAQHGGLTHSDVKEINATFEAIKHPFKFKE